MLLSDITYKKAFLISPVVDMKKLIEGMLAERNITLAELEEKKEIDDLFWPYYLYACNNTLHAKGLTHIAYGQYDNLTSLETISNFAKKNNVTLDIMINGEHRFHTPTEMEFITNWITKYK